MPDDNLPAIPDRDEPVLDTSYEIALDDEPDGTAAPVHDPAGLPLPPEPGMRLPVVPEHLRTLAGVRKTLAEHAANLAHEAAFQAVRSPWTLLLSLLWAVVGLFRLIGRLWNFVMVTEQSLLRSKAVIDEDSQEYRRLQAQWKKDHDYRRILAGIVAVPVLIGILVMIAVAPWWGWVLLGVAALPVLARVGRPEDRPIITPSMTTPRFRLLNDDVVLRAYYAAGLGDPVKPGQQITFAPPGMARDGDGTRVKVDLPYGKGLDDAVKARPAIASGLDVTVSQVFISRDATSHRRHILWVADRDPLAVPVGRTPLLACRQTDIWKPAPFGLDERGALVNVPVMWNSVLVGALPRQGKTFSARLLALYAALDPYVKLSVFDGKGSPDWRKFALVADSCAFGLTPTKHGLPPEILLATLQEMRADVQDRYDRLSVLEAERSDICPEGKLTRAIARDPRFGMPVRLLVIDEVQEYFDLGEISKEIAALLVFMAKVAPGAGVSVLVATQKPSGIGGTGAVAQQFTSFRDQLGIRFSLRTSSWQVSEMVLGQGAYSEGLDSSTLLNQYKGVGILRGAGDESPTVRTHLADGQDAEKILLAARAIRQRAGTLSGMAAGEDTGREQRDVLADVLKVFGSDAKLQWEVLADRLAAEFPDRWTGVTAAAISQQCRDLGVRSSQVWGSGANRQGCTRADVEAARASS